MTLLNLSYIIIPAAVAVVAFFTRLFVDMGMDGWYEALAKPVWIPGGSTIGIVWACIYLLLIIVGIIGWNTLRGPARKYLFTFFSLNLIFNTFWAYIFFAKHWFLVAILVAVLLLVTIALMIFILHRRGNETGSRPLKYAGYFLYPYAGWMLLVIYITYVLMVMN